MPPTPESYAEALKRVMQTVLRAKFLPPEIVQHASKDQALPIGWEQTTSQPSLIGQMLWLLDLQPGDKVLEIGTGSGYQTALLAALGWADVYSIEIIPQLATQAAERLRQLGYAQVHLKVGDGAYGWPECAPFAGIIVSAAPPQVPPALVEQLVEGGRLIIPVGPLGQEQQLWKLVKRGSKVERNWVTAVSFVPLTHHH
jgi:protein-L-isoaspartate(D-aspartate) O-methyltransferase